MKITKTLVCLLIINILIVSFANANSIIYKKNSKNQISSGTYLSKYEILTDDGWVVAKVLEIDTSDEYTKLQILSSEEGVSKLSSTMAMTAYKNAIAGINGDFFSGKSGKGHSIGMFINDGTLMASISEENKVNQFSTLFISDENDIFMDYFNGDISLLLGDEQQEIKINCLNKYTSYSDVPSIYTKEWGKMSIGSSENFSPVEIVVENNRVVEIRENQESCEIPENGFVVMATGSGAWQLKENLKIGSLVSYKVNYTPNIEKIKFAISGGAILIENGIIPETFSHNVSGRNPRTCIGYDKTEKIIYLITVDGRISTSIGMTQQELAEFLKSINVYSAINLDGGGSTTMVAKDFGDIKLSEINTPSGGTERLVTNGVGVVSVAPDSTKIDSIEILMDETNIFQGEKRKAKVVGFNQYHNAIEIDQKDIEWDYKGVDLEFTSSGDVTGNTVGEATIIAKVGKIKGELEINILSPVNEIVISPKKTAIAPNNSVKYRLQAKNKNGYYAGTNDDTYELKIYKYYKDGMEQVKIPEDAKFEDLTFTAETSGTYILSFAKGFCVSYAKVDVGVQQFNVLNDFETKNFSFDPYPDEVGGDAVHSDIQQHSGKYSAKLEYDFDRDAKIRGAYIVLDETITVPKDATSLAFWVYNDQEKDEKLKIKAIDANGHTKILVIQDNIIHEGWEEIKYSLNGINLPLTITDIYVAQDNENIRNNSFIYVDDFGYYTSKIQSDDKVKIPQDIKLEDQNNINIRTSKSYDIAFIDDIKEDNLMVEWLKNKKLIADINKNAEAVVFTNNVSEKFKNSFLSQSGDIIDDSYLNRGKISIKAFQNQGYDIVANEKATIITIDISQNSIRKSDGTQFENIKNDIIDDDTGNVILVLNNSIDNFEDLKERRVFVDMLCDLRRQTSKNIFVVHDGFFNDFSMERGVKFLSINSQYNEVEELADYKYLIVSVFENEISYEYKKIF